MSVSTSGAQAHGVPAQGVPAQRVPVQRVLAKMAPSVGAISPQQNKKSKSQLRAERVNARQIVRNEIGFGSMASSHQRYACASTFLPR